MHGGAKVRPVWSQMRAREDLWCQGSREVQSDWTTHKTEGETESHSICCTSDFSLLFFPPFFPYFFASLSFSFLPCSFPPNLFPSSFPLPPPLHFFTPRKIKTNYFLVSLAFADLLVSVLVMPFGAIELVQDIWIYGEMFCLVRTSLDVLLTTASIFHLCCISLDR